MNRLSSISAVLGAALLILLVASASAYAENKPDPRLGTYSGTFGGDRATLEVREGFKAIITLGDSEATGVRWVPQRIANKVFVMVMMGSVKLLYALTEEGLELRAPANPETVIKMKNGKPMSILRRGVEGSPPTSEEDTDEKEASPTVGSKQTEVDYEDGRPVKECKSHATCMLDCPEGGQQQKGAPDGLPAVWCEKEGKKQGKAVAWYVNGGKQSEGEFKDGKQHGKWMGWYPNGNKSAETQFKDGLIHGKGATWYESGRKLGEVQFKNGKEHGQWTMWHENGQKKSESHYKDGKLHGALTAWYEDGQLKDEREYIEGVDPVEAAYDTHLAPIGRMLSEWVQLSVLVKKVPKARKSLNKAGHEADRRTACAALRKARKKYGKHVHGQAIDSFCQGYFDPMRDPMMPDNPVKVACTTTNAGWGGVHDEGHCIEITPDMCGKVVRKMCRGNK
jgi:antitoxin component YwqK of YwqJK toxin-antitoxin module